MLNNSTQKAQKIDLSQNIPYGKAADAVKLSCKEARAINYKVVKDQPVELELVLAAFAHTQKCEECTEYINRVYLEEEE